MLLPSINPRNIGSACPGKEDVEICLRLMPTWLKIQNMYRWYILRRMQIWRKNGKYIGSSLQPVACREPQNMGNLFDRKCPLGTGDTPLLCEFHGHSFRLVRFFSEILRAPESTRCKPKWRRLCDAGDMEVQDIPNLLKRGHPKPKASVAIYKLQFTNLLFTSHLFISSSSRSQAEQHLALCTPW